MVRLVERTLSWDGYVRLAFDEIRLAGASSPQVTRRLVRGPAEPQGVLTTEAVEASDVVITMGCGDACPVFPGKRYLDWALEDPAGKGVASVRPIRDEIETRVRGLLTELRDGSTARR